ncbi:MAG: ACT domain-containing protein [Patescibacteria group bacterium]
MAKRGKSKTKRAGKITVKSVTQVSVLLANVPGELAKITQALADAGVSVRGLCRTELGREKLTDHFIVDKVAQAKKVFARLKKKVSTTEILAFSCPEDRRGVLVSIARVLGDASINIENIFVSTPGNAAAVVYIAVPPADVKRALTAAKAIR